MESVVFSAVSAVLAYGLAYLVHAVRDRGESAILAKLRSIKDAAAHKQALADLLADVSKPAQSGSSS